MKNEFDEKQLADRGRGFQYGFITALLLTVVRFCVTDVLELSVSSYTTLLVSIWLPITVCMVYFISKDAYEGINANTGRITMSIMGIAGLFLLLHALADGEPLLTSGALGDPVGSFIAAACMITWCVAYWVHQYRNSKRFRNE